MENKTPKSDIIKYIFTILLFLFAIASFPSIASFIFLLTAIIIFPSCWEKLTNAINGKLLVVICIILFFIACAISPAPQTQTSNNITSNNMINVNTTQNTITENATNIVSSIPTFENEIDVNIIDNNTTDENISNTSNTNTNSNTNSSNTSSTSTKNNTKKSTTSSTIEKSTSTSSKKTSSSSSSTSKSTSSKKKNTNTSSSSTKTSSSSGYVWVGNTGHKYHKQSCGTLKGKGHKITLKEALAEGREPCKVCYK